MKSKLQSVLVNKRKYKTKIVLLGGCVSICFSSSNEFPNSKNQHDLVYTVSVSNLSVLEK